MKFKKYINSFKEYLETHNFSERTIETYSSNLKRFLGFIEKYYFRINSVEKITKDILLDYQNYIAHYKTKKGQTLSNSSQCSILKAIKKFFHFLIKSDLILKDPSTVIVFPKEEQRLTRNVLTEKEMETLLNSINLNNPVGLRNKAITELLYSCGIRTSELCNLKIQDVNLKEQTVTIVKGKGNKSRLAPIGQYASLYIQLYLEKARKYMLRGKRDDPGYLFLSRRGNPFNKNTINKTVMASIRRKLRFKKHITCYVFRHTVAKHLLSNKVDITYIAQLLGHASLKTTQKYLKIEISDLKRIHSLCHPREIEVKR